MASAINDRVNETARHPKECLYIVDDETELLSTLAQSLEVYGLKATTFERPGDLLAVLSDNDVGCVISDLRMPEMGGIELIKQLKHDESCLSVILLTAFADVPTAVDVMKLGAVSVVEKPFNLKALAEEISSAMEASRQAFEKRNSIRQARAAFELLSEEERAVLELAIAGTPNREIAQRLSISPRTVDRRRHSSLRKLNAESVAEYAVLKTKLGI